MREALLLTVVAGLSIVALFRPRIGLYGYIWFALMRPDALAWSEGRYPYSLALAVATLAGSLRFLPGIGSWILNPFTGLLLGLQIPIVLSAWFALNPALSHEPLQLYGRVILMALLIPLLIRSEEDLRRLLLVIAGSLGALGVKFGLYGLLRGGVWVSSGHAGFLGDNNDLALALTMAVPLCWYARTLIVSFWAGLLYSAAAFLSVAAVIMSHSRGAALALAATILLVTLRSKHKLAVAALLLLACGGMVYLVKETYVARLSSLEAPQQERSANLRLIYAQGALAMWRDYPVLGVGYGTKNQMQLWSAYMKEAADVATPQVIHNSYLQMLVDSGTLALILYVTLLFGAVCWLGVAAARQRREQPGREAYSLAMQTSLVAFAIGSTFLSRVQFDLVYMLLMAAAAWYGVERTRPEAA